jgi:hypothetical protein
MEDQESPTWINIHLSIASEALFVEIKFFLVNHVMCAQVSRLNATVQITILLKDSDLAKRDVAVGRGFESQSDLELFSAKIK